VIVTEEEGILSEPGNREGGGGRVNSFRRL